MDLGKIIGSTVATFVVWVICQSCWDAATAKHHTKVPETPPKAETKAEGKAAITADDLTPLYIELTKATLAHKYNYSVNLYNPSKYDIRLKIEITLKDGRKHIYSTDSYDFCNPLTDCNIGVSSAKVTDQFKSWDIVSVTANGTEVSYIDIVTAYYAKHKDIDALLNQSKPKPEPTKPPAPKPAVPKPQSAPSISPPKVEVSMTELQKILPELGKSSISVGPADRTAYVDLTVYNPTEYRVQFKLEFELKDGTFEQEDSNYTCAPHSECEPRFYMHSDSFALLSSKWRVAGVFVEPSPGFSPVNMGQYYPTETIKIGAKNAK